MFQSLLLFVALLGQVGNGPGGCIMLPPQNAEKAPVVQAPAEHFIGPNLPCFTKQLSDNDFKWWVIEQNEIAAQACRLNAQPAGGTAVHEQTVWGWSSGMYSGQVNGVGPGFNNLKVRSVQTIAPGPTPYGGGPLWIHNPYVRH